MLKLRREAGNALRANPNLAGHYFCAARFRLQRDWLAELLPRIQARRGRSPSRPHFAGALVPVHRTSQRIQRLDGETRSRAVESRCLARGEYPVRVEVIAPDGHQVLAEQLTLDVPDPNASDEPPLVREVFSRELPISGATGEYKFVVQFERGAAATGEESHFNVFDPADMPAVDREVTLWGQDDGLAKWLAEHNIRTSPYSAQVPANRELVLVGSGEGDVAAFRELAQRIARGSTALFLSPAVFALGGRPTALVPCVNKGTIGDIDYCGGYYRGDTLRQTPRLRRNALRRHTRLRGLPQPHSAGRPGMVWPGCSRGPALWRNSCSIGLSIGSRSGHVPPRRRQLRPEHPVDPRESRRRPVAERLLRNLLNYVARDLDKPIADLPVDFQQTLKAIGYE